MPAGTAVRGVDLDRDLLTVDLTRRFESGGGSLSMQLRLAQVVFTATQFPSVTRVAFRIDGRPVSAIGGEGVVVQPPVGRSNFEQQAPPILVERPLPLDRVRPPIVVRGIADVFEARLTIELRLASGQLLSRHNISATAGTGTRGSFTTKFTTARIGRMTIVAYTRSPKDGRAIDVTRVPINLVS